MIWPPIRRELTLVLLILTATSDFVSIVSDVKKFSGVFARVFIGCVINPCVSVNSKIDNAKEVYDGRRQCFIS